MFSGCVQKNCKNITLHDVICKEEKIMIVDILSDLHFDNYFPIPMGNKKATEVLKSMYAPVILDNGKREPGDVLVIAGDIGHYNQQNIQFLKLFQKLYYKHIVCVLGNHDYYLINISERYIYDYDSFKRAAEMRDLINAEENMYCLDGNVIEINGVKFGGCASSYSNAYLKAHFPLFDTDKIINDMWKNGLYDSERTYGVENYDDIYKLELPKIEVVYKECDVMITHVNPSHLKENMALGYREDKYSTFFSFDGHKFMQEGSMTYWIFGHTHDRLEYELHGVKCICNPFGYPFESLYGDDILIKSIEV